MASLQIRNSGRANALNDLNSQYPTIVDLRIYGNRPKTIMKDCCATGPYYDQTRACCFPTIFDSNMDLYLNELSQSTAVRGIMDPAFLQRVDKVLRCPEDLPPYAIWLASMALKHCLFISEIKPSLATDKNSVYIDLVTHKFDFLVNQNLHKALDDALDDDSIDHMHTPELRRLDTSLTTQVLRRSRTVLDATLSSNKKLLDSIRHTLMLSRQQISPELLDEHIRDLDALFHEIDFPAFRRLDKWTFGETWRQEAYADQCERRQSSLESCRARQNDLMLATLQEVGNGVSLATRSVPVAGGEENVRPRRRTDNR